LIAVGITVALAAVGTAVILLVLKAVMGLRVTPEQERMGLDLSQHSETAYILTSDYEELATAHSSGQIPAGAKVRSQNA
jgi:ammonia channel protein AmtB